MRTKQIILKSKTDLTKFQSINILRIFCKIKAILKNAVGWDRVIGIACRYGADGPGIESWLGPRFSAPFQNGTGAHPAFCTIGNVSFCRG